MHQVKSEVPCAKHIGVHCLLLTEEYQCLEALVIFSWVKICKLESECT